MYKIAYVIVSLFVMITFTGCYSGELRDDDKEELLQIETNNIVESNILEVEETKYIPNLFFSQENLEIYTLGDLNVEKGQYTNAWKEEDCKWYVWNETFEIVNDYIYCMRTKSNEDGGEWFKRQLSNKYSKCKSEEVLREAGLHHDERYVYYFYDFQWNDDNASFLCRRIIKNEKEALEENEMDCVEIWIYKDFKTGKEVHIMFNCDWQFKNMGDGFVCGIFPDGAHEEKEGYELWQYSVYQNEFKCLKKFSNLCYTESMIISNKENDISVAFGNGEVFSNVKDCKIFTSWDAFEVGIDVNDIEMNFNMLSNNLLIFNDFTECNPQCGILSINRNGVIASYSWEEAGNVMSPFHVFMIEDRLLILTYDKEYEPCNAYINLLDLFGNRVKKEKYEPLIDNNENFGLKEIMIRDGIMYGLYLNEAGSEGICKELDTLKIANTSMMPSIS